MKSPNFYLVVLTTYCLLFCSLPKNVNADVGCYNAPVIYCPSSFYNCPGSSTDPAITGSATAQPGAYGCDQPIVTFSDGHPTYGPCHGEVTIYRTWRAEDPHNPYLFSECTQVIRLKDDQRPHFTYVPGYLSTCDSHPPSFGHPQVSDNCSAHVSLSFSDHTVPGDCYTGTSVTRTWTATDDCGNTATASQTIRFDYDPYPPTWSHCPHDIHVDANSNCEGIAYWTPPTAHDNCQIVSQSSNFNPGDVFPEGETIVEYRAVDDCGNIGYCRFKVIVSGGYTFDLHCPKDIVTKCRPGYHGAPVKWSRPRVDFRSCGGGSCTADYIPGYVYMGRYNGSDYYCSSSTSTWPAAQQAAVGLGGHLAVIGSAGENNFLTGSLRASSAWIGMSDAAYEGQYEWVNGDPLTYTNWYPGQPNNYNNQDYVELLYTGYWNDATNYYSKEYIVEIPCQHYPYVQITQIEGPPNGSTFPPGRTKVKYKAVDGYGNTAYCSFYVTVKSFSLECPDDQTVYCHQGSGGAYVHWDLPTVNSCGPGGGNCTPGQHIPGFIYMGDHDGHQYYCSDFKATWPDAKAYCESKGGHLAVINSNGENDFLANQLLTSAAYIGLSDALTEGNFTWVNGDPLTFTKWYPGQPNNYHGYQDYVELLDNGYWNDQDNHRQREFIMEKSCWNIRQIHGPHNGAWVSKGKHRVTYVIDDGYGSRDTCSFYLTVKCNQTPSNDYCDSGSHSSSNTWIDRVHFASIRNHSGNDDGYGDYSHLVTNVLTGSTYDLWLYPGIPSGNYYQTFWGVFIDYNNDGDFDDVNEDVGFTYGVNPILERITIPDNANSGYVRMRIMASKRTFPTYPCATLDEGEVEDYTLRIHYFSHGLQTQLPEVPAAAQLNQVPAAIIAEGGAPVVDRYRGWISRQDAHFEQPTSVAAKGQWLVYPNPANQQVFIEPQMIDQEAPLEIQLYNTLGQLVQRQRTISSDSTPIPVDLSRLHSGVYLVQVLQNDKLVHSERLVCRKE